MSVARHGLRAWHAAVLFGLDQVLTGLLIRAQDGTYDAEVVHRTARIGADACVLLVLAVLAAGGERSVGQAWGRWKGWRELQRFSPIVVWYPFFAWSLFIVVALITAAYDPAAALARYGFSADNVVALQSRLGGMDSVPAVVVLILSVCVTAPLVEEFVFRGVLFRQLARRFGMTVAILVTSTFFGLVHGLDPFAFIRTFVLSMVLCLFYARTGSVLATAVLHGAVNLSATFIAPALASLIPRPAHAALQTPLVAGTILALTVVIAAATVIRAVRDLRRDGSAGGTEAEAWVLE